LQFIPFAVMVFIKGWWNLATFSIDLILEGSVFQRVSAAPEIALVPILVLTLGTTGKS